MKKLQNVARLAFLQALVVLLALPLTAAAATKSWNNPAGGNWSTGANWTPSGAPGSADDAVITLAGTYTVNLNVGATVLSLTLGGASGTQTLANAGQVLTLSGTSAINANGAFEWSGGYLQCTVLNIAGALHLSGSAAKTVSGPSVINNSGTTTWTGTGDFVSVQGIFNNLPGATFDDQTDANLTGVFFGSTFNNGGTFTKNAGVTQTVALSAFNNTGTVNVMTGTLRLVDTSPVSSGAGNTFFAAAGTEIDFQGSATFTDTTFSGGGLKRLLGFYSTFYISGTLSLTNVESTAALQAPPTGVTLNGTLNWTSGQVNNGPINMPAGSVLNISGASSKTIAEHSSFNVSGTTNWTGGDIVIFGSSGAFNNLAGATFNDQTDATLTGMFFGNLFRNGGTFTKTAGVSQSVTTEFANTGTVNVLTGTLHFVDDQPASSGPGNTFTAAAGAEIDFQTGGTFTDTVFNGPGPKRLLGASTYSVSGMLALTNVEWAGLFVVPISGVTLSGRLNWTSGQILGGPVAIPVGSVLELSSGGQKLLSSNCVINNSGTTIWTGTGNFRMAEPATFNNLAGASFNDQTDAPLEGIFFAAFFNNSGTFTKSAGASQAVSIKFNNTGTVDLKSGTFSISEAYTQTSGNTILDGGNLANTLPLDIQGGLLSGSGTITGNVSNGGTVGPGFSPGLISIVGNYVQTAPGALNIELNGRTAGTQFDQLNVSGTVTLAGALNISLGYVPSLGDSYTIIANDASDAVTAAFTGLAEGAVVTVSGFQLRVSYAGGDGNDVVLTVVGVPACSTVTLSPATVPGGIAGTAYSQTISASGGASPYTFVKTGGTLPTGLSLSTAGVLSGLSTAAGAFTFTVTATDANGCPGSQSYTINVSCPTIAPFPGALASGAMGTAYSQTITASGGAAPYSFTITAGLPPTGLNLSPAGLLSGSPLALGSFTFTVTATDADNCTGSQSYTVQICAVITPSPATLPAGTAGTAYTQTITAVGGTSPWTFAKTAGTLPTGLSLSTGGVLSGSPTAAGSFTFSVTATDASGCTGSRSYTVGVSCPTISVSPATLPAGAAGQGYSQTITGSGGTPPYTFTKTAGTLPTGLSLSTGGVLSGAPLAAGSYTFTVTAADANGCAGSRAYTIDIDCIVITLSPATLPDGIQGLPYFDQTITASGGTLPCTFAQTDGTLPAGLSLSTSGVLSGTPTMQDSFAFTVTATDANGCTGSQSYVLVTSITEFPIPTGFSGPAQIAAGPDGNLWFTEGPAIKIGRITLAGAVTEFPTSPAGGGPLSITAGPDGNLWFGEGLSRIGRMTTAGSITEFPVLSNPSVSFGIAAGPDGDLWFTEQIAEKIGQISTAGAVTEFPLASIGTSTVDTPDGITSGPDGNVWFTELTGNRIARITAAGVITEFSIPTFNSGPVSIVAGPDGNLWFTEGGANKIGQITPSGVITEFGLPLAGEPVGIAVGSDGALWFTERSANRIGRFTTSGVLIEFALPIADSKPYGIAAGSDGALWFTEQNGNRIGRIATGCPAIALSPAALPGGAVGTPYSQTVASSGGISPYALTVRSGSLPPGLTLSSSGAISGTPTAPGTFSFTIAAADSSGCTGTRSYAIQICPVIALSPATLPGGSLGLPYDQTLTASGGTAPYTFTQSAGTLPTSLSLSAGGVLSGTPSSAASFSFTATATDANGCSGSRGYVVDVTLVQTITEFPIPTGTSQPEGIAAGSDGALWFAEFNGNRIGRVTTAGVVTEFALPTASSRPTAIAAGSDGALWFTEQGGNRIGRIATSGGIAEFAIPTAASSPTGIAAGPDDALWFTEQLGNRIGRITTTGAVTEFVIPTTASGPEGIAAGSDGALWFTEQAGNKIGRVTTAGVLTEFRLPTAGARPTGIAAGSDGALWFTEPFVNKIGRITTAGAITEFALPAGDSDPWGIAAGPDGALWFTELNSNRIGRVTLAGAFSTFFVLTLNSGPYGIAAGSDGAIWFTEFLADKIGRLGTPCAAPAAPLLALSTGSAAIGTNVTLTWTGALSFGQGSYDVLRTISGVPATIASGIPATAAPSAHYVYTVTGPAGLQDFQIKAIPACNPSASTSNTARLTVGCVQSAPPPLLIIDSPIAAGGSEAVLTWDSPSPGFAGTYTVVFSTDGGRSFIPFAQVAGNQYRFVVGFPAGTTVLFEVLADPGCGPAGISDPSPSVALEVVRTCPRVADPVAQIGAAQVAVGDSWSLHWTATLPGTLAAPAGDYEVRISRDNGRSFQSAATTTGTALTGTPVPQTDLGKLIFLQVVARPSCSTGGVGTGNSNIVFFQVIPGCEPPQGATNLQIAAEGKRVGDPILPTERLALSWDPPASGNPPRGYLVRLNGGTETLVTGITNADVPARGNGDPITLFVRPVACTPQKPGPEEQSATVALSGAPAGADFTISPNARPGHPVMFTDTSSPQATEWLWVFDDGTQSTVQSPAKTFAASGAHTAALVATNGAGSSTKTRAFTVLPILRPTSGPADSTGSNGFVESDPGRRRAAVRLGSQGTTWLNLESLSSQDETLFLRFLGETGELLEERRLVVPAGSAITHDLAAYGLQGSLTLELVGESSVSAEIASAGRTPIVIHR